MAHRDQRLGFTLEIAMLLLSAGIQKPIRRLLLSALAMHYFGCFQFLNMLRLLYTLIVLQNKTSYENKLNVKISTQRADSLSCQCCYFV